MSKPIHLYQLDIDPITEQHLHSLPSAISSWYWAVTCFVRLSTPVILLCLQIYRRLFKYVTLSTVQHDFLPPDISTSGTFLLSLVSRI